MRQFIKSYNVTLTAKGPVFIGSGRDIMKKEYIYDNKRKKVLIPDMERMYLGLAQLGKQREFERFILQTSGRRSLNEWLMEQRIGPEIYKKWINYELDCGDALWLRGREMQIVSCMKDAYGRPYVPGSSIKGMLRTILLANSIIQKPEAFQKAKESMRKNMGEKMRKENYLQRDAKGIEMITFHSLQRTERRPYMVNDRMAGLIVSDSQPLSVEDLVLCQKLEYHKDGKETALPLLRECIRPGTKIQFTISIDSQLNKLTGVRLMNAVRHFSEMYYERFSSKFPNTDYPAENTVWLGGGAGFVSKTVVYALFGEQGVGITKKIFEKTGVTRNHKHEEDGRLGVSPHILKLTSYQGKHCQFGECMLDIFRSV